MPLRRLASFALIFLVACDGPPAPTDAGVDAGPPPPDAGSDAGPAPALALCDPAAEPGRFPAPDAWGPNRGAGGPTRTFEAGELYANCGTLDGGPLDRSDHHNLVTMFDGYLLMPWAPEYGGGGLTFYEFTDPCAPIPVGRGFSTTMRESHSIGISTLGGRWAVVDQLSLALARGRGGIQFWDIADPTAPAAVADLELPGFLYPDAYAFVTLSVFWQVPYVYVAGASNGVYIVDAADPRAPRLVGQIAFEPVMRAGQVQALGNLLVVTAAEGARTVLLDISDPLDPQPIPGGDFFAASADGATREAYFTNFANGHVYYANTDGGGLIVWDVRDPRRPAHAGERISEGNGGYVFVQGDHAFVGESSFAAIYEIADLSDVQELARLDLEGDLDTATPIGNVVVLSVDEEARPDEASAIAPWREAPDTAPPTLTFAWPADGATELRTSSRLGVGFSEMVDVLSAHEGSVRLYRADAASPDAGRVPAIVSAQETLVNVYPRCPLAPSTEYVLEVLAGGVADFNGNTVADTTTLRFTTGPE